MFDDLAFLKKWGDEGDGPCCLKHRDSDMGEYDMYGFIFPQNPFLVNLGYIWDGGNGEVKQYGSFEEMIADGWIVD